MREKIEVANTTIAELAVMYGADPDDVALPAGR
jgi:cation transporter-like permease